MITAREAHALYDPTGVAVTALLEHDIDPKIREAAENGKRSVFIQVGCEPQFSHVEMTGFQIQTREKLNSFGFKVTFARQGDPYVPSELADEYGNGPLHRNVGFIIEW